MANLKLIFVHSDDTMESRDKLGWVTENNVVCDVVDFMKVREDIIFQGVPTLLILEEDKSLTQDNILGMLFNEEITIENIEITVNSITGTATL